MQSPADEIFRDEYFKQQSRRNETWLLLWIDFIDNSLQTRRLNTLWSQDRILAWLYVRHKLDLRLLFPGRRPMFIRHLSDRWTDPCSTTRCCWCKSVSYDIIPQQHIHTRSWLAGARAVCHSESQMLRSSTRFTQSSSNRTASYAATFIFKRRRLNADHLIRGDSERLFEDDPANGLEAYWRRLTAAVSVVVGRVAWK